MSARTRFARVLLAIVVVVAVAVAVAAAAARPTAHHAVKHHGSPSLSWQDCGDGYQCSSLKVPRDYKKPNGPTFDLAIIRLPAQDQAHRIGSLFVNFGGPGGTAVDTIQRSAVTSSAPSTTASTSSASTRAAWASRSRPSTARSTRRPTASTRSRSRRRSTSTSRPWSRRTRRTSTAASSLNGSVPRYISTGNMARDMDRIRAAMGDAKLNYFGFSYGTFLGATYASLFPHNYRAMVLDGPVDVTAYIDHPSANLREQSQGFERALGRFFQACAADQAACGFGGSDPADAFEQLVQQAYDNPIPAGGSDPRPVDGDDLVISASFAMYAKQLWPFLVQALQEAQGGDGSTFRFLADFAYGRNDDGTFSPGNRPLLPDHSGRPELRTGNQAVPRCGERVVGPVRPLLVEHRLLRAELRALRPALERGVRRPVPHVAFCADRPRGRDDLRPGDAVQGRSPDGGDARQRASPDDARRRPHGLRRELALHRRRGQRVHRDAGASRGGHRLPAGGAFRVGCSQRR